MRWLNLAEVLDLHRASFSRAVVRQVSGISACWKLPLPSPLQTLVDGNKRIGHAAMDVAMILNGLELSTDVDDAEAVVLGVATGLIDRGALMHWLEESQIPSVPS
jgi:hypothetical protein